MRRALVLAGGLPQIELIKELKDRGYFTILVDYTLHPIAEKVADKFYRESTLDVPMVRKIAIDEKVDIVITCCTDQALATVSQVAQELNLPCYINDSIGTNVTNKQYMKKMFLDNGIPTAKYIVVDKPEDLLNFEYPVVIKPVDCNSSKGVIKAYNKKQEIKAVQDAISYSRTHKAVIEEFIEGKEISVDAFVTNGVAKILCTSFSEKIADEHRFVIYKGQYPAVIDNHIHLEIEKIVQRIADVFGLVNSPMLVQLLIKGEEVFVIEFGARTGGCVKYRMIEHASGVNVIKSTVDLFENLIPDINPKKYNGYVVDEFIYCMKGIYSHLDGVETCITNGWATEIYELKNSMTKIDTVNSSGDRIAAIVIVADSYEDYVEKHNCIVETIRVIDNDGNDIMRHDLLPKL